MDYLEEAKKYLVGKTNEKTETLAAIAFALIAIAERLDTWIQDREELGDLTDLQIEEQSKRIAELEQGLRGVGAWREVVDERTDLIDELERKCQAHAGATEKGAADVRQRLDELERWLEQIVRSQAPAFLVGAIGDRMADLERKLNEHARQIGYLDQMQIDLVKRIDELERNVSGVTHWQSASASERVDALSRVDEIERKLDGGQDVFNTNIIERIDEIDSSLRRLGNRVSDLEMPGGNPEVGVWRQCTACNGDGEYFNEDTEALQRCDVCGGGGRRQVPVTSEVEWADKLQEVHFSVASLERKLSDISQVLHNDELDRVELASLIVRIITR